MVYFAEHTLIRVAGLPFSSVERTEGAGVLAALDELERLYSLLEDSKQRLCDRLHAMIHGLRDIDLRRALLTLKRAVFNSRPWCPAEQAGVAEAIRAHDPTLWEALSEREVWVREYNALLGRGEEYVRSEWRELTEQLAHSWALPHVRTGVLFAQPRLYRELAQAAASCEAGHFAGDSRLEMAALSYCYRMATKTSPFSTFTATGVGRICGGPDAAAPFPRLSGMQSSFLINSSVIQLWAAHASSYGKILSRQFLSLNKTLRTDGGRVSFIVCRRKVSGGGRVDFDESLADIETSPSLELALSLVEGGGKPFTLVKLKKRLAMLTGIDEGRWEGALERLVDGGLLSVRLDYEPNSVRAVDRLAASATLSATPAGCRTLRGWGLARDRVKELEDATPAVQAELLSDIHRHLTEAFENVGVAEPRLSEQTLVRHNCYLTTTSALPRELFAAAEPALRRIFGLLPLFNADLSHQKRVERFFLEHYGEGGSCESVLDFFSHLSTAGAGHTSSASEVDDPFASGGTPKEAARAAEERGGLIDALRRYAARDGARGVEVDGRLLDEWAGRAAEFAPRLARLSAAFAGQFTSGGGDGAPSFVLNKVLPGYGVLMAPYASDEEANPARAWLASSLRGQLPCIDPDAEVVELIGTFGFDGQIRPRLTRRCLVYPGEEIGEGARVIPWQGLAVAWDASRAAPILLEKESGRRILPLHLGSLSSIFFPPFYRFITCFGPSFSPDLPLLDLLDDGLTKESRGDVRHYCRMTHDGVVLLRESWCIPSELVPAPGKGENGFTYFRRLRSWASGLGLPRRVFVTPMRIGDYLQSDLSANHFRQLHKPFYVDWDSLASHRLFRRFTKIKGATLTVCEMLPLPGESEWCAPEPWHVTEYVCELYDRD